MILFLLEFCTLLMKSKDYHGNASVFMKKLPVIISLIVATACVSSAFSEQLAQLPSPDFKPHLYVTGAIGYGTTGGGNVTANTESNSFGQFAIGIDFAQHKRFVFFRGT